MMGAPGELAFLPLDPLFAAVVRERELRDSVPLSTLFELDNANDLETINIHMAPLRDALICDLCHQALLRRSGEHCTNTHRVKK